jgi:hypothetical protein
MLIRLRSKLIVRGLVSLSGLTLVIVGCIGCLYVESSDLASESKKPSENYVPVVHQLTCEECGKCFPRLDIGHINTTLQHCPGKCCNTYGYTFQCDRNGETFMVTVNGCDQIEWITPSGIFPMFPVSDDGDS